MRLFDFFRKKDSSFDLDKVLRMNDQTAVVIALDTRVNELSNYGGNLTNLTEPQKNLLFVENADGSPEEQPWKWILEAPH